MFCYLALSHEGASYCLEGLFLRNENENECNENENEYNKNAYECYWTDQY